LYIKYSYKKFTILAFPSNQFGQEPGDESSILKFLQDLEVTFPVFNKVIVNGRQTHPLFAYLRREQKGIFGSAVKWNFTKFLCDRKGKPVKRYGPATRPYSIEKDIELLLRH